MNLTSIAQYRIDAELGAGRFTETYRAYDTVRHRPAALKLLRVGLVDSEPAFRDFLTQASAASELVHPHLAWVWETGEVNGRFFLVERYINGGSLAAQLADSGPLTWEQARPMVESLAEALEFAHALGWVHGGISPQDILLSPDLGAVLTDFGLTRLLLDSNLAGGGPAHFRYAPAYLPPEVLQGSPLGPAADAYALVCTLLEALAGHNPFTADSLAGILEKHALPLAQPLIPPGCVPWRVSSVIEQALSPEPGARYQSLAEFLAALDRAASPPAPGSSELAQQEAQILAWRATEEQARLEAEEAARLAALEQARLEIQQQAHREAQQLESLELEPLQPLEPVGLASAAPSRRRPHRARSRRLSWLPWLVLAAGLLVLAGFWLNARISSGQPPEPTPSAAITLPVALPTEAPPSTPTASLTPSLTASPSPTATFTRTVAPTRTPTASASPTLQPSPTLTSPRTPTRSQPGGPSNNSRD